MKQIVNAFFLTFFLILLTTSTNYSQDLSGFTFCLDPGHSPQSENQGPGGVGEYSVNVKVAHYLESLLSAAGADTVILSTPETIASLGLAEREDISNFYGVDRFISIHHQSTADNEKVDLNDQLIMPANIETFRYKSGTIEENRLLNDDFLKLEALSVYRDILKDVGKEDIDFPVLSGVVHRAENNLPINGASVRIAELDFSYQTDNFDNGFYLLQSVPPGNYIIEAAAPGYKTMKDTISLDSVKFYSLDFYLLKNESPFVEMTIPDTNQVVSTSGKIEIVFNRSMNTETVEQALRIDPEITYQLNWLEKNRILQIDPNPILAHNSKISVFIDTIAQDIYNHALDSSPNDLLPEPYLIRYRTEPVDPARLQILSVKPEDYSREIFTGDMVNIEFSKSLEILSVNDKTVYLTDSDNNFIDLTRRIIALEKDRSLLQLEPVQPLIPGRRYSVYLSRDVRATDGISLQNDFQFSFFTENSDRPFYFIDDFSDGVSNWLNPVQSSRSRNFNPAKTDWQGSHKFTRRDTSQSGHLWFELKADGLLDLAFKGSSQLFDHLQNDDLIGTYLFGDSSLVKFRFYFSDSSDGLEAGPWRKIDWYGWKPLLYRIGADSVFELDGGNGLFNGERKLAGFQIYSSFNKSGEIYLDDWFLITSRVTSVEEIEEPTLPRDQILIESYPSPFSRNLGHTGVTFTYEFPSAWGTSPVNLTIFNTLGQIVKELINQPLSPGQHQTYWDGLDKNNQFLPAGIYFIRVQVGNKIQTRRLTILN